MVDVTQADLDAAKALCDYFCWVTIPDDVVQAFAAHRKAALLEGVRLGLEAASSAVIGYIHPDYPRPPGEPFASAQVKAIDPAAVLATRGGGTPNIIDVMDLAARIKEESGPDREIDSFAEYEVYIGEGIWWRIRSRDVFRYRNARIRKARKGM